MRTSLAPLRVSGFGRLLVSYTINELGDTFALIALSILVFDQSGSAVATAGLFVAAKFVPAFLSPALTARIDRLPVARTLTAIYALEALLFAGLALLATHYSYAAVLALALIDGSLALTARAISRGAMAGILTPQGLLREGNALTNVLFGAAAVAGALLGGVVVAGAGVATALLIDAASFAAVAIVVVGLQLPRPELLQEETFAERFREGLRHVRTHPVLPVLLTGQAFALLLFYLIIPIEVVYAKETLEAGDTGLGFLLASWSGGILIGSLAYLRLTSRSPLALVIGSTTAIGIAYGGMAVATELWMACAFSIVGGIGNGFQWVSVMTMLQEATPTDLQARVVGLLESIGAALPGVGFLLGGALTALWSPRVAYAVSGIGVLLIAAAGAAALPRLRASRL